MKPYRNPYTGRFCGWDEYRSATTARAISQKIDEDIAAELARATQVRGVNGRISARNYRREFIAGFKRMQEALREVRVLKRTVFRGEGWGG